MKDGRYFDSRTLRVFAAVASSETLTQAATRLEITQSAVSQAIKRLETQTGTELIVRRSRPIKLTATGKILNEYVNRAMADAQRVLADIQMAAHNSVPKLRIGMIDSFGEAASGQIMERIKPFSSKLSIRTGVSGSLSEALLNHDLDLLITSEPMESHHELLRFPILRDPFVIVVPQNCGRKEDLTPRWLAENVPFVHYARQNRIGILIDLIARRLDVKLMTRYELDSTQTLLRFVQAGHGWAIVTGLCIIPHQELLQGMRILPLAIGANARYLSLLCHEGELGTLPEKVAHICRDIYATDLVPQLKKIAPWFGEQAYTVSELPLI